MMCLCASRWSFVVIAFFFQDAGTPEIYTLSLHDALPIWPGLPGMGLACGGFSTKPVMRDFESVSTMPKAGTALSGTGIVATVRSEEHTSELQSRVDIVCRLLLEKKNIWTDLRGDVE